MLKCRDVAHNASDYLDKSMPWPRRLAVLLHLFICRHCRRFVRHLRIVRRFSYLRGGQRAEPDDVARIVEHACSHDHGH